MSLGLNLENDYDNHKSTSYRLIPGSVVHVLVGYRFTAPHVCLGLTGEEFIEIKDGRLHNESTGIESILSLTTKDFLNFFVLE